jgi:hypothetical protein
MTHFDRKTYVASVFLLAWFSADYDFQIKVFFFPIPAVVAGLAFDRPRHMRGTM